MRNALSDNVNPLNRRLAERIVDQHAQVVDIVSISVAGKFEIGGDFE